MKPFHKDADQMDLEHPPEIWVQVFEHVAEQSQLYRAMLGKNGSPWFTARMREYIVKLTLENEQQWKALAGSKQQIDQAMPEALPVMQLSHVLIGTIVWWLESERSYTPRQIATWFWRFAFYGYVSARGYEVLRQGRNDNFALLTQIIATFGDWPLSFSRIDKFSHFAKSWRVLS